MELGSGSGNRLDMGFLGPGRPVEGIAVDTGRGLVLPLGGNGILHDVNLTVLGPGGEVLGHHPEGRPGARDVGHLDPRLEIPILPALGGVHPDGIDLPADLLRLDPEGTVGDRGQVIAVLAAGHIFLDLVVSPAAGAGLVPPFGGIRQSVHREVILPHKGVSLRHIGAVLNRCTGTLFHLQGTGFPFAGVLDFAAAGLGLVVFRHLHFQLGFALADGLEVRRQPPGQGRFIQRPGRVGNRLEHDLAAVPADGSRCRRKLQPGDQGTLGQFQGGFAAARSEGQRRAPGRPCHILRGRHLQQALTCVNPVPGSKRVPVLSVGRHRPGSIGLYPDGNGFPLRGDHHLGGRKRDFRVRLHHRIGAGRRPAAGGGQQEKGKEKGHLLHQSMNSWSTMSVTFTFVPAGTRPKSKMSWTASASSDAGLMPTFLMVTVPVRICRALS